MAQRENEGSTTSSAPSNSADFEGALSTTRLCGLWTLLALPYLPIGLCLCLLRLCMSLQAILILLIFPEGVIKRYMLRVFFTVLGISVITGGNLAKTKLIVSNKVSFLDHIALHLAVNCISVSTGGHVPVLATLFPHWTFPMPVSQTEGLVEAAKALPEFSDAECPVDYVPYAVQPESLPTNGRHALLKFSDWAFSLNSPVQPVALTVFRPFPLSVSTVHSSGWWDLIWTLFAPITVFHVKFLPVLKQGEEESAGEFSKHVQQSLADSLKLKVTQLTEEDATKWLQGPPQPKLVPNGPIISPKEFNPSALSQAPLSPELETMVRQVAAVLPQVPHSVIRRDLVATNDVDATITNLLEGRVKYTAEPSSSSSSLAGPSRSTSASQLFRRKVPSSSSQRQLSLEERKRELLQNARRKYMEKHGL